jgi:hypothetical protein
MEPLAANWNSFLPDLIVGLVTGLVVGIVLLVAQHFTADRSQRAQSKFGWESLKPTLRSVASMPTDHDLNQMLLPGELIEIDRVASNQPLSLWQSHLNEPDELLDKLILLLRVRSMLEADSRNLDLALRQGAIKPRSLGPVYRERLERIVRGRAYGVSDTDIHDAVIGDDKKNIANYSKAADDLISTQPIADAFASYVNTRKTYQQLITRFLLMMMADSLEVARNATSTKRNRRLWTRRGGT